MILSISFKKFLLKAECTICVMGWPGGGREQLTSQKTDVAMSTFPK